MEILQMGFFYKESSRSKKFITNQKGFALILLMPFFSLIITSLLGLSAISLGIRNITFTQSTCLLENLSAQKQLKIILKKLLSLNQKVTSLHKKRQFLETSLKTSIALGLIKAIPILKKQIILVKFQQKILSFRQNRLLSKSQSVKKQTLKNLTQLLNKNYIQSFTETSSFKKALALSKKNLSKEAVIYKPLSNFSHKQKTIFSWKMKPFFPLFKSKFSKYQCVATLERSKMQWQERLFH